MAQPPLGFIEPKDRTAVQEAAHSASLSTMRAFTLAPRTLAVGEKVILTDFLKAPEVQADMGMLFPGFRQLTGSCVGVTEGEITAVLSAVQRMVGDAPTKAFIPWWPYAYGMTRYNEGDRGQGEGAVSSVMGQTLEKDGTFAREEKSGLPQWDTRDGLCLTSKVEYQWSDGGSRVVQDCVPIGRTHKFGTRGPVYDTQAVQTAVVNGYPVANGCAYYIGSASIRGTGNTAYARGKFDGRGGHETSFIGVWNHPNDGILFGYWNHWDASTYPADPAGLPRCACWTPESEVARMMRAGWDGINPGEAFAVSHVDYFPAQADKIINWGSMWGSP